MNWAERETRPELLDLGPAHYGPEEYQDCLKQLGRIGRLLNGDGAGLHAFRSLPQEPASILDVGCGGGWFARRLAATYPNATVEGVDANPDAIAFARATLADHPMENLRFHHSPSPDLQAAPDSVDVVTATLVLHHLSDEALVDFLRRAARAARQAVIINDLQRHPLAWGLFKLVAPLLFPNRLVCHDGPLSIRKAFRKADWPQYLQAAELDETRCRLEWHWAFRWILIIDTRS